MSRPKPDSVRVVTWNLWWRFGRWRERLEAIAGLLAEVDADICGLQEVWEDDDHNEAVLLAERLGMYVSWLPTPAPERWQHRLGDPTVTIGNAVLSRWPIVNRAQIHLPTGTEVDEGRTAMFAEVQSPYGRVSVYNTQLNSGPSHSAVRVEQVAALAEFNRLRLRRAARTHRTGSRGLGRHRRRSVEGRDMAVGSRRRRRRPSRTPALTGRLPTLLHRARPES